MGSAPLRPAGAGPLQLPSGKKFLAVELRRNIRRPMHRLFEPVDDGLP
jgi:hypothetical protein